MDCNNPKAAGFNYGRALPWHQLPVPPEYVRTRALSNAVAKMARIYDDAAWALEMALRNVRLAETEEERNRAIAALEKARADNDIIGIDHTYNTANMPSEPEIT